MIRVSVEIHEDALTQRVQITASCIERALELAREGRPGREVRVVFLRDSEAFFDSEGSSRKEVA